jgi:hypothetical protein
MDPHKVLGLAPTAPLDEAEDAYRRLLRRYHPDLHQHDSPEGLAAAELRTMALNAAIHELRGRARVDVASGFPSAPRSPGPSGPRSGGFGPPPPRRAGEWDDEVADWRQARPERPAERPPSVACPLCGASFSTAPALKAHVTGGHDLRLDRRRRLARMRTRSRRHGRLPVWVTGPVNVAAALAVGTVANALAGDARLATWIGALTMAPTVIRVFQEDSR